MAYEGKDKPSRMQIQRPWFSNMRLIAMNLVTW